MVKVSSMTPLTLEGLSIRSVAVFLLVALLVGGVPSGVVEGFHVDSLRLNGSWQIDKQRSTAIDPWKDLTVEIEASEKSLVLKRVWKGHYGFSAVDSVKIPIDGTLHPVSMQMWPDNRHVGVFVGPSAEEGQQQKSVSASWLDDGHTLQVTTRMSAAVSQGQATTRIHREYRLSPNEEELIILELRSTRPRPIRYVLKRKKDAEN